MTLARKPARLAIAVSGSGRSLANFLSSEADHQSFRSAAVIASRPDCRGVEIAREHHLPLFIGDFSKPETAAELDTWLQQLRIEWIALAGFLKLFPVPERMRHRVINIHPALLPKFGGKGMFGHKVHAAVLAAGETVSGATVHFVNSRYDEGAIIAQILVPVRAGDDVNRLAARVFAAECHLYPEIVRRLIEGDLPHAGGQIERTSFHEP